MNAYHTALLAVVACTGLTGCEFKVNRESAPVQAPTVEERAENTYWEKTRELYEKAKASGETVPEDVKEWVQEDIRKMGAFEYKLIALPADDPAAIETALNEWGRQRWDCFWADQHETEIVFYLKKSTRSYLRALPAKDLLKLIPFLGGDGGGGE